MKNKKGAKQQKFIQQVEKQVKSGGVHPLKEVTKKTEKELKLKEQKELALLFKPVQSQKIEKGADPKSIVCAFFKQGQCGKGDRCKFSHDLTIERKAEKRSLYVDMRDDGDENDTMENWDEEKLLEVIEKKHGKSGGKIPTTDIVSTIFFFLKFFLHNFVADLQTFHRRCGKIQVRMVLAMSNGRELHLQACLTFRLCIEERQEKP